MLTVIIFLLIRKFRRRLALRYSNRESANVIVRCVLLYVFVGALEAKAQQQGDEFNRRYEVRHNGAAKGEVSVKKSVGGGVTKVRLVSNFNFRMLLPVTIKTVEEASFYNGILTYSSVNRKINGKQKIKQKLVVKGQTYEWSDEAGKNLPAYPIKQSVLSLYFQEPKDQLQVFSDAHRANIPVREVEKGKYRLDFPNGNTNYYNYADGVCTLVEVNHSMFSIQFILIDR